MSTPKTHALLPAKISEPMSTTSPASPFDSPKIASLIASYISEDSDLARCARVSHSLHDICIPILWKSIHYRTFTSRESSSSDRDRRMSLIRHGKLITELTFTYIVSDDDVKVVAENCTGLKVLNFLGAEVTAQSIAILIPSDSSQTQDCDPDDGSKMHRTRPPSCLESLSFNSCQMLAGLACLEIVSLLGPQLKRLSLSGFRDITDRDMIRLVRRCPNLVGLRLNATTITDGFLKSFAQEFPPSGSTSTPGYDRQHLENLNLNLTKVSTEGIVPVVRACRSTLKTLSAQFVKIVNDKVLFALVEDPTYENASFTNQVNVSEPASDEVPITYHRFSPNTVLTEIRLSDFVLTDAGFQVLFRFATELVSIELNVCAVSDGALMVLAETYRNRMKALGLGVPAAWREYELAEDRVQAMAWEEEAAEGHRAVSTAATSATTGSKSSSDTGVKVFTNGHVPGGLRRLYLRGSHYITNKGVRAILRSCVGLELLDIGARMAPLTLELFHGPWACSRLKDLNISSLALETTPGDAKETTPGDLKDLEYNSSCDRAEQMAQYREEVLESSRFPLAIDPYPRENDFDERGNYEHMEIPMVECDRKCNEVKGNTPRRRAILKAFYSKLGQLNQLRTLNMSNCDFHFRVKDGLELVLPGLKQNLIKWSVDLEKGYQMGNSELEFFGKHFGYGHDFIIEKGDDQDQWDVKTRMAPLQDLVLNGAALRHVSDNVVDWARRQGFNTMLDYRVENELFF